MRGFDRGQSASEFIRANANVLLIIVFLVVLLFYLGMINTNVSAKMCFFSSPFTCRAYSLAKETRVLTLEVGQATGKTVSVVAITCSRLEQEQQTVLPNRVLIQSGTYEFVSGGDSGNSVTCPGSGRPGEPFTGRVCLNYTEIDTGLSRSVCGQLATNFE